MISPADPDRHFHERHLLTPLSFSGQSLHKGKSSVQFLASAKNKRPAPEAEAEAEADTRSRKSPRRERSSEGFRTPPAGDSEGEDEDHSPGGSAGPEIDNGDFYELPTGSREEGRARQRVPRSPMSPHHKKPQTRKPRARRAQAPESTSADNAPHAPGTQEHSSGEDGTPPPSAVVTMRQPQRRAFWEKEDERTLRELVAVHGSFWVHMEKKARREELFLVPRTQQQIRDKARNMKVDYLKCVSFPFPPSERGVLQWLTLRAGTTSSSPAGSTTSSSGRRRRPG